MEHVTIIDVERPILSVALVVFSVGLSWFSSVDIMLMAFVHVAQGIAAVFAIIISWPTVYRLYIQPRLKRR